MRQNIAMNKPFALLLALTAACTNHYGQTAPAPAATADVVAPLAPTSHTIWGWEHDVVPGFFTENHDENVKSLAALRALAAQHPQMKIVVGHETDGVGTGVQD
jgi:hypothetical protein